jgi:glycosyltransferase involved in cell wall biosynthesis
MVVENCPYLRDPRVRKEAEALTVAGYRVTVICPAEGGRLGRIVDGVSIREFPIWQFTKTVPGYFLEYAYAMIAIAVLSTWVWLKEGFDIIHVANPPDCIVPILWVYKLIGKLVIYDQHDLSPELYAAKFGRSHWFPRLLLALERCSYSLADHVIVPNESYKELALRRGRLAETKVTVVRNGPDLRSIQGMQVDPELRRKSRNIIAFAGVTGPQDGLDGLCRALHYLRYGLQIDEFYCIVVGDGDALASTEALARELRIDDKMGFAGWVSDAEKYARYLATADICVAPDPFNSYNDQSTFVKIMEYMAAGKPIVGFDLRETRRSAQDAAVYARINDVEDFAAKIASLIDNPDLRQAMGRTGARRVEKELAWQYSVPNLLSVYQQVARVRFATIAPPVSPPLREKSPEPESFVSGKRV